MSTRNRKTVSYDDQYHFGAATYKVNVTKRSGIYKEIMQKMIEQLSAAIKLHKRLLVVRFDLHSYDFDNNSRKVSLFRKAIIQWIERNYNTQQVGYVWVREQERSKKQHYHFALFIDGNKIRHPKKLLEVIADKWSYTDHHNNHMPVVKNPYYFVDNEKALSDAIYRISYLAKERSKGHRPDQAKDYSTSRLKYKIN